MNKIQKLKYIKNTSQELKVLLKFYDYIMFNFKELNNQDLYGDYWQFIGFCNGELYKAGVSQVRKFTTAENKDQVLKDCKLQIQDFEKLNKIYWSENFKIFFGENGRLRIAIFDDELAPDYPENYPELINGLMK